MTYSTRILVAIGDLRRREPIVTRLTLAGYPTRVASSGAEAIDHLKRGVEAMVLDIDIPGRSCVEVLEWMQRTGRTQKTPVLLVAKTPRLDVLRAAAAIGVRACVRMPVNEAELLARVRAMLSSERRRDISPAPAPRRSGGLQVANAIPVQLVQQEASINVSLGSKIATMRQRLGLTAADLAYRVSVPLGQFERMERGELPVPASKLHAIAEVLNTPVTYFFGRAA